MKSYKFTGIVLGNTSWREKDRLVWLLTRWQGKQHFLIRGVRSLRSRRSGIFLTANIIRGIAYQSRNNLPVIGEVELIKAPLRRQYLGGLSMLLYLGEFLMRLLPENVPEPKIFDHLADILITLEYHQQVLKVIEFNIQLPKWLGFGRSEAAWSAYRQGQLMLAQREAENFLALVAERKFTSLQLLGR